jgi:RimJ/RimL family protein N-acetyltransferase
MRFVGRKVTLRAIERQDLPMLAEFHNDPALADTIEFSWPISLHQQEKFFERASQDEGSKRLCIELPDQGVIGYTGFWGIHWIDRRATNGIIIGRKDLQRQGYGTDAIMTMLRVAFDHLNLHRIDAEIFEHNPHSLQLYVGKCGFREEGRRREHIFHRGRFYDRILVGITAAEYRKQVETTGYWNQ